MRAREMLMY